MKVVPEPLLIFSQPHFLSIMGNRTGQPHGVRQTVRMVDLDAGTGERPQSEPNCQNANGLVHLDWAKIPQTEVRFMPMVKIC